MKSIIILLLSVLIILLGFSLSSLRKELSNSNRQAELVEERNKRLHADLVRVSSINRANEQFLSELEEAVNELEARIPFETMEKYIPKDIVNDAKPVIERLRFLHQTRQSSAQSDKEEERK